MGRKIKKIKKTTSSEVVGGHDLPVITHYLISDPVVVVVIMVVVL
ncbi:MAG: hypothetical protein Q8O95_03145 [bacterium]|nr:hypothetical protein [bacterium]